MHLLIDKKLINDPDSNWRENESEIIVFTITKENNRRARAKASERFCHHPKLDDFIEGTLESEKIQEDINENESFKTEIDKHCFSFLYELPFGANEVSDGHRNAEEMWTVWKKERKKNFLVLIMLKNNRNKTD